MAESTTIPKFSLVDFQDPNLFRFNSVIAQLYSLNAQAQTVINNITQNFGGGGQAALIQEDLSSPTGLPGNVTITRVDVIDTLDGDGNPTKSIAVTYAPPGDDLFTGVWVYLDAPDTSFSGALANGTVVADGSVPAVGTFNPTAFGFKAFDGVTPIFILNDVPAPTESQRWRVYAASGSEDKTAKPVQYGHTGATPSYQFLVDPPSTASGREFATNVTNAALAGIPSGWTANPNYTTADSGDQYWQVKISWQWPDLDPSAPNTSRQYAKVYRRVMTTLGDVELVLDDGIVKQTLAHVSTSDLPEYTVPITSVPYATTTYRLWIVSRDTQQQRNSIVPGVTPYVQFTIKRQLGSTGTEYTNNPTGVSWSVTRNYGSDGTAFLDVLVSGTDPTDPAFGGYHLWVKKGSADPERLRAGGRGLPLRWQGQEPATVQTWIFYLVAVDVNSKENSITGSTPQYSTSVGSTTGTGDLRRMNPSTYSNEFEVSSGAWRIRELSANTIKTGALQIGGPGMVSQSKWFDTFGGLIGFWGDNGSDPTPANRYVGLWSKVFRFGGADPTDYKIQGLSDGSVNINNVALLISAGSERVSISATDFVKVYTLGGTSQSQITSSSIQVASSSGDVNLFPGLVQVANPGGTLNIYPSLTASSPGSAPTGYLSWTFNGANIKIPYYV